MTKQETIFVVDDTPANLGVLFDYLRGAGFKVLVDTNSASALQTIPQLRPDLILLDIMMPEINGFECCRRLKEQAQTQDIPVIFMTALSESADKVKGLELGAVDYITKPFQGAEVLARVHTHLTLRRLQKTLQEQKDALAQHALLLEQNNAELQDLNAAKDMFFSIIAHDLRGPLSSLRDLTYSTAENFEQASPETLRDAIDLQYRAADNLCKLMDNLLTWSRMQRGAIDFAPRRLRLKSVILYGVDLVRPMAEQKQISFDLNVQELEPQADMDMLETVLRNLLSNAIKFTRPGGRITVTTEQGHDAFEVSVSDTGIGIPEEKLPLLFQIHSRFKRVGTAREKGTGLGLILCKEFIERHGGRIWAESDEEQGSTFRFTLPLPPADLSEISGGRNDGT